MSKDRKVRVLKDTQLRQFEVKAGEIGVYQGVYEGIGHWVLFPDRTAIEWGKVVGSLAELMYDGEFEFTEAG